MEIDSLNVGDFVEFTYRGYVTQVGNQNFSVAQHPNGETEWFGVPTDFEFSFKKTLPGPPDSKFLTETNDGMVYIAERRENGKFFVACSPQHEYDSWSEFIDRYEVKAVYYQLYAGE